jgi:urease accessory protein
LKKPDARLLLIWTVGFLTFAPASALAHAPIKGIGTFYDGVLHPIFVPAHVLLLVGLGLLLAQHAPSRYGWLSFLAALAIGLTAGQLLGVAVPEGVLFTLTLIAGLLVVLDSPVAARLIPVLATAAGIAIGLDSSPDGLPQHEAWRALSGTGIGGILILSCVGGLATVFARPWQRVGIRVVGAWMAASVGIVLALTLVGPGPGR